ncbi:MAG: rubredoxin [Methyloprofundus sp.]|uniref:rubredoxin n=1 Tax=Methyloprofundus sp. TaxID=2020875 RepID=UPI003257D8CC
MSAFKKYPCSVYDHIYDEELGDADSGIEPDTLWEDISEYLGFARNVVPKKCVH